jgi:hypothetical protein
MAERKTDKQKAKLRMMQKAHDLYMHENMSLVDIGVELSIDQKTVSKYLNEMGVPPRRAGRKAKPAPVEFDPYKKFLDDAAEGKVEELAKPKVDVEETYHARKNEETEVARTANSNMSAADKYQAYIAGQGMRMMRDALPHIKKPTNMKELEILDSVIRRNLGLGGKGAAGKVKIDVNILNNSKASPSGAVIDID